MRDLSRAFNDTKGQKYGIKDSKKGVKSLENYMKHQSDKDKKDLLAGIGKDSRFLEYLGKNFGVSPDALKSEWKKFENEAEILSNSKRAALANPNLAKYRPSDEALRELGLKPEELPFSPMPSVEPKDIATAISISDTLSDSANKKKARRNKKKRKKQQVDQTKTQGTDKAMITTL